MTDAAAPRRAHRPALTTAGAVGWTVLGTVLPGLGLLRAGRRLAGGLVLGAFLLLAASAAVLGASNRSLLLSAATDPAVLTAAAAGLVALALAWVAVVVATWLALRPRPSASLARLGGAVLVGVLSFAVAAPLVVGAGMAWGTAGFLRTVFHDDEPAGSVPSLDPVDPWAAKPRLNVLVIGGDHDTSRSDALSIRADSTMVASINTATGATTLVSLPRNTMRMPFPKDSPLHRYYPQGFGPAAVRDDPEFYLDALYRNVPATVPTSAFAGARNPGAEAMKQAVGAALGLDIDYYVQVDMDGFRQFIDAIGGVRVNVNYPVPVGGDTDKKIPPRRYLKVGPDQLLKGADAMWYARGRYGLMDYDRMARQRCVVNAVAQQATPAALLANFQQVLAAGESTLRTDVPQKMLAPLADLAGRVKGTKLRSVAFESGVDGWLWTKPDFAKARKRVAQALAAADRAPGSATPRPTPTTAGSVDEARALGKDPDLAIACAYHPAG